MAVVTSQVLVGTSATALPTVPAGPSQVTFTVIGAATVIVYLGITNSVTTTNGAPVQGGQTVTISSFEGSAATPIWAVASAANTPVGVVVSTDR